MNIAAVASDIICLMVLGVLIYGSFFEIGIRNRKNTAFLLLILCSAVSLIADMLSTLPENSGGGRLLMRVTTDVTFFNVFITGIVLADLFFITLQDKKREPNKLFFYVPVAIEILSLIVTVILCFVGNLYSVEKGYYETGTGITAYWILVMSNLAMMLVIILMNSKALGIHDTIAFLSYIILPCAAFLLSYLDDSLEFGYQFSTVSVLLLYVVLHSEQEKQDKKESYIDSLTGLGNRRAYEDKLGEISDRERLGIVFCDVNAMKYTNDNFGHGEGDNLLQDAADLLCCCFRRDEIYRVSGDEFVVLMPGISLSALKARKGQLTERLEEMEFPIMAVGTGFQEQGDHKKLLISAEQGMYRDKQEFHKRYPKFSDRK